MIDLNNTCFKNDNPAILDYLSKQGYDQYSESTKHGEWLVLKDKMVLMGGNNVKSVYKQIHLVDGEFQYVKEAQMERDSFNKHGFETPNFEGEILKEVENVNIGWVRGLSGKPIQSSWSSAGICSIQNYSGGKNIDSYSLTPIKKEWYEDENNIGKIIYDTVDKQSVLLDWLDSKGNVMRNTDPTHYRHERFRPATKEEVLSLLMKE